MDKNGRRGITFVIEKSEQPYAYKMLTFRGISELFPIYFLYRFVEI